VRPAPSCLITPPNFETVFRVVIVRMRNHQPTLDYVKKRKADGKGKMEIIRCLKRFVAREIFGYLCGAQRSVPSISKAT
jgi:transposase